ncbi:MAG: acyl transferase [Bacteroidetes bacterium]|nr:MAG: acyl transferase [Bacteroidota bacterium]
MKITELKEKIFRIENEEQFNSIALEVFRFQYSACEVYNHFCQALQTDIQAVNHYSQIPFLPIELFKKHRIVSVQEAAKQVFYSSGTTGQETSRHFIIDPEIYKKSFTLTFQKFFGQPQDYHILALLPGYLEREGSSLIYMVNELISLSQSPHSGFYLDELESLQNKIKELKDDSRKVLLIGVSFALLDLAEKFPITHPRLMVMETGGMKGRRREMVREELHETLMKAFSVDSVYSEYGMTELLSQAYSVGEGIFSTPPWMKVLIRDMNDPLSQVAAERSGGISVIDLANLFSCSFIATQDLGRILPQNRFVILGRFDNTDVRGCNLLVQ